MTWYDRDVERREDSQCKETSELPDYGTLRPESELEPQDIDLIRWMLTLTPVERLRYAQRFATGVRKLGAEGRT